MSQTKPIPTFSSEAKERTFWEALDNDSTKYFDSSKSVRTVLPKLKPTPPIHSRLPD